MDGGGLDVVAAADGERQPEPVRPVVGAQDHVGGGVVGIGVHRVGTIELTRRGEADVEHIHACDARHQPPSPSLNFEQTSDVYPKRIAESRG
jgi:hypothetical protein